MTIEDSKKLILQFNREKRKWESDEDIGMSLFGFYNYLQSAEANGIFNPSHRAIYQVQFNASIPQHFF